MHRRLSMPDVTTPWRARAVGPAVAGALALTCVAVAPSAAVAAAPPASAAPSAPTFALTSATRRAPTASAAGPADPARSGQRPQPLVAARHRPPAGRRHPQRGQRQRRLRHHAHLGAGRWLDLAADSVRLAPGATRRVGFRVAVPADAAGASHYAGVVAFDAADVKRAAPSKKASKRPSFSFGRINRQALPITVRLPGPRLRSLELKSATLDVKPAGAALMLGLRPGGTVLTSSARVTVRVSRGPRTILTHAEALGQLFPGSALQYRIPWRGQPTAGEYRVAGTIRPAGAETVTFDRMIIFTPAKAKELKRVAVPPPRRCRPRISQCGCGRRSRRAPRSSSCWRPPSWGSPGGADRRRSEALQGCAGDVSSAARRG
jgi:hypothetical protein